MEVEEDEKVEIELKSSVPELKVEVDEVKVEGDEDDGESRFLGEAVPAEEARRRWPDRYQKDKKDTITQAKRHFLQAEVDGQVFYLEDDAFVKGEEGQDSYICKIIEFFEAVDGSLNFTAQWFYRACDTVIQKWSNLIDDKRVFFSEVKDENPLDCLLKKLDIKISYDWFGKNRKNRNDADRRLSDMRTFSFANLVFHDMF